MTTNETRQILQADWEAKLWVAGTGAGRGGQTLQDLLGVQLPVLQMLAYHDPHPEGLG